MEWYEAIILGIVQGLTEFLPISSSGHLEIASYILKTNPSENLMFTVVVHIATAISIIYVFRKDINEIIKGLIQFKKKQLDFILKIFSGNLTQNQKVFTTISLAWIIFIGYLTWWNGLKSFAVDKSFRWDEWFWFGIVPAISPYFFYYIWKKRD